MKTQIIACRFAILFLGIACLNCICIMGQLQKDPLTGIYKSGGAPELFMTFTSPDTLESTTGIMEVSEDLSVITSDSILYKKEYLNHFRSASAVGDFNGDGADEVVTIMKDATGKIKIAIPLIGKDLKISGYAEYYNMNLDTSKYER